MGSYSNSLVLETITSSGYQYQLEINQEDVSISNDTETLNIPVDEWREFSAEVEELIDSERNAAMLDYPRNKLCMWYRLDEFIFTINTFEMHISSFREICDIYKNNC